MPFGQEGGDEAVESSPVRTTRVRVLSFQKITVVFCHLGGRGSLSSLGWTGPQFSSLRLTGFMTYLSQTFSLEMAC